MPLLEIEALGKRFVLHHLGNRVIDALCDISLSLAAGEHVTLAGPSGSGKSTLLRCVYRTYRPTAGSIRFRTAAGPVVELTTLDDVHVADLRRGHIGYVSQFLRAEPRRTALDVVARAALGRGLSASEANDAAADALRSLGLSPSIFGVHPVLLSGGEKQRVNLAAGTVGAAPRLLLIDEPTASLDARSVVAVIAQLKRLQAAGTTILSVFHDPNIVAQVAERVLHLDGGRLIAAGEIVATTSK